MLRIIRLAATGLVSLLWAGIAALLATNVDELAKQKHWNEVLVRTMPSLQLVSESWWFWLLLGIVTGLTAGLWLTKIFPEKAEDIGVPDSTRSLGPGGKGGNAKVSGQKSGAEGGIGGEGGVGSGGPGGDAEVTGVN